MKKAIALLFALLLALGSALPLAGYLLARRLLGTAAPVSPASSQAQASSLEPGSLGGLAPSGGTDQQVLLRDQDSGQDLTLSMRDYLIGAVASEMPVSWPDEALKAQAVASHSYILYCRDHRADAEGPWLTVDPARRQGCLTDPVLRSYWGTAYAENYARLSALIDQVAGAVLYYDGAPAGASYFAISNGQTEASENRHRPLRLVRHGQLHPVGLCGLPAGLRADGGGHPAAGRSGAAQRLLFHPAAGG